MVKPSSSASDAAVAPPAAAEAEAAAASDASVRVFAMTAAASGSRRTRYGAQKAGQGYKARCGMGLKKMAQHCEGERDGRTPIDTAHFHCGKRSLALSPPLSKTFVDLGANGISSKTSGCFWKNISKLINVLKYTKPLPTCLKFALPPKTLLFGPPLNSGWVLGGADGGKDPRSRSRRFFFTQVVLKAACPQRYAGIQKSKRGIHNRPH